MDKSKPIWIDYKKWECHINDMYGNGKDNEKIVKSFDLLTGENCKFAMELVTKEWVNSTTVKFTNKKFNPVSWLGQAACCLMHGAKATETVSAWMSMSKEEQERANNIAKEVIKEWKNG